MTARFYEVGVFEYGQGTESPCCTGFRFESGIPPTANEPTLPRGNGSLNPYVAPPAVLGKPTTVTSSPSTFENLSSCRLPDGDHPGAGDLSRGRGQEARGVDEFHKSR